jgi:DNA invertase Pin-like site-specific DNA recombinase
MWWKKQTTGTKAKAVVYYRHSAEDRQENSIPIQREQIRNFAQEHGIEIIHEFQDAGKSGLSTEGRDGFNEMLEKVISDPDFQYVLALDVSRWGRFQDIDMSGHYRSLCRQYGKEVVYTSMGFPKEDDPLRYILLSFEGYRAAAYSRELSDKVFKGCVKIAEQGFHAGGCPPYGLHRLLLDEGRKPVQILERGQRKSIQNQRVTLTPGNKDEVRVIRRIFLDFVRKEKPPQEIAFSLNREGILSPGKKKWSCEAVRSILTNELYIGTMVYNKTGQKLLSKTRKNPRKEWIRKENAFKAVVDRELFNEAQAVFKKQLEEYQQKHSIQDMIFKLKKVYDKYGFVTTHQISVRDDMLSPSAYINRFHSLGMAFQRMYPEVLNRTRKSVFRMLSARAKTIEEFNDYYILNDSFSVLVQPSVPVPFGYNAFWAFRPDPRIEIDITLGVPLSSTSQNYGILGYLAFPRLLVGPRSIRLFHASEGKWDLHGYSDLDLIEALLS